MNDEKPVKGGIQYHKAVLEKFLRGSFASSQSVVAVRYDAADKSGSRIFVGNDLDEV